MWTRSVILSGNVVVENVLFSWRVTDDVTPSLTVSHPVHGTETEPLADTEPRFQARAIAHTIWRKAREVRTREH